MTSFVGCGDDDSDDSSGTLVLTTRSLSDLSSSSLMGTLADSALSSFTFTVKELYISTDGGDWIEIYNNSNGVKVDILATSSSDALKAEDVPKGTYSYAALKVSSSISYQRAGVDCSVEQNFTDSDDDIMSVITTEDNFNDYGQVSDGAGGYTAPSTAPSEIHTSANDAMFWVLDEAITITKGETTSIALSAVSASLEEGECDEDPGKPVFSLVGLDD